MLSPELVDDAMVRWPVPVADAISALAAAAGPHETRDRVVEVFRTATRVLGGYALSARLQFGPGPGEASAEVGQLVKTLRRRGLTDGQWVGLTRELLRPWKDAPERHVLPGLVKLFTAGASSAGSSTSCW